MQWHTGLAITDLGDGLLVQQGGVQYIARRWCLTDNVIFVIETAIKHGLEANWVPGHPSSPYLQGGAKYHIGSHHITFARSNKDKYWIFVLGGESKPPNFKFVTFNSKYWSFIHRSGFPYRWEHSGGHNVYVETQDLDQILSKLNHTIIEEVELAGRSRLRTSILYNAGITSEYDLELAFIEHLGRLDILHSAPLVRVRFNGLIPDILLDVKNGPFVVVELKFDRASLPALDQVQCYMRLPDIRQYTSKTITGILIAPSFSEEVIESVGNVNTQVSLYKFGYLDKINLVHIAGDDVLRGHGLI